MEDDVLKLKEVVSVTFDTTPYLFSKNYACRPLVRQGKIHRHWLSPIFSSLSPSFFSRELLTYMRLPLASYS